MNLILEDETITPHDMVVQYGRNFIKTELMVDEYLQLKENEHRGRGNLDPTRSAQEGMSSYKLPKMALTVYDGTCLEWLGWWSQFKTIHESPGLSEVEKFQYLVQSMRAGTRADRLVRSYPLITENYPKVVKALQDRFGDKNQGWSSNEKLECFRCGYYQGHSKDQCPAKDAICNKCRKKVGKQENSEDKWCEVIKVNDQPIKFKIDTGAEVLVMPEEIYLQYFGYLKTEKADKNLFGVSKKIEVNGMFQAFLESKRQKCKENIYIVKGVARPLLSCRASEILGLVRRINIVEDHAPTKLDPMLKFPKLFTRLGKIDIPYEIKLKEGAIPYSIYTPRRVPLPLMKELQMELERMTSNGVIEKVEGSSEWCSPMVLVAKPSGKLRICVDLSILNQNIL
ncbi:hypothetical protein LAZ67_12002064 [Cordylochernes scorpioides]|uniref:Peptidase A2 domain-containing protein n=1 Tax=Cordylochernes scorpioides TaxID=51811 RepID=A0ABY6L4A4_9ARAC|nr:hypothetical protein LAZ67_12002064 [Cordylochernes scorpioides]